MWMMPRAAAASLIGDHHDDSVPISQDDDVSVDDNKNDSATPQPPPKKPRVKEQPIDDDKNELEVGKLEVGNSSDPDAAARVAFQRWCRYIRPEGRPDGYSNDEEKERGFQNFKTYWLHKEDEHNCPLLNRRRLANLFYLADLSPEEFQSHPNYSYPASYCHISNELLDEFDEIASGHDDFFEHGVYD
ncbi:uncharacterized protein LOC123887439 [Trifolium pratense]|uniref:uncharacterized protein LOC123887439 n=1 Tax=Trifolium pratense TaxID=57577 RepID=UPI001E6945FC|nr:uncharacterized protein LOC123887439 [Trifolium pratense]